jgi:glucan-binding YG repeat protein
MNKRYIMSHELENGKVYLTECESGLLLKGQKKEMTSISLDIEWQKSTERTHVCQKGERKYLIKKMTCSNEQSVA